MANDFLSSSLFKSLSDVKQDGSTLILTIAASDPKLQEITREIANSGIPSTTIVRNGHPGEIRTVTSTMYGGKSVFALHLIETSHHFYRAANPGVKKILYVNHVLDTRSNEGGDEDSVDNLTMSGKQKPSFSTHSTVISKLKELEHMANFVQVSRLHDIDLEFLLQHELIAIDEAQFFDDLIDRVQFFSEVLGLDVYAMGLVTDFERKKFGQLNDLKLLADENIELRNTYCSVCASTGKKSKAIFNHRLVNVTGKQIEIGSDNYVAVCRKCWLHLNPKKQSEHIPPH